MLGGKPMLYRAFARIRLAHERLDGAMAVLVLLLQEVGYHIRIGLASFQSPVPSR